MWDENIYIKLSRKPTPLTDHHDIAAFITDLVIIESCLFYHKIPDVAVGDKAISLFLFC